MPKAAGLSAHRIAVLDHGQIHPRTLSGKEHDPVMSWTAAIGDVSLNLYPNHDALKVGTLEHARIFPVFAMAAQGRHAIVSAFV